MVEDAILNLVSETEKKIRAEKKRLRQQYKTLRLAQPVAHRMQAAEAIANQLGNLSEWNAANYIAGYWACGGEVPLHIVQMRTQAPKIWCLPVVQSDNTLKFAPWRSGDDLVSNHFGIPEPDIAPTSALDAASMSIVLLPLLAYTRNGQRLGMGGGYYDRSFAFRNSDTKLPLLVGVAYSCQEVESLPSEAWDIKLDLLINEHEVVSF